MEKLTKKIIVNGQEMVMSSMDGRSWFLRPESMYDFEKRLRLDFGLERKSVQWVEAWDLED